ncbi:MAG: hypothetical protein NT070_04185 [Cyanobacteria bacterium]|nr:hypothetical protein [Cyanobacteriota bacterium]
MTQRIVIDTGPLIAYLNPNDTHHAWAIAYLCPMLSKLFTNPTALARLMIV